MAEYRHCIKECISDSTPQIQAGIKYIDSVINIIPAHGPQVSPGLRGAEDKYLVP